MVPGLYTKFLSQYRPALIEMMADYQRHLDLKEKEVEGSLGDVLMMPLYKVRDILRDTDKQAWSEAEKQVG